MVINVKNVDWVQEVNNQYFYWISMYQEGIHIYWEFDILFNIPKKILNMRKVRDHT